MSLRKYLYFARFSYMYNKTSGIGTIDNRTFRANTLESIEGISTPLNINKYIFVSENWL